MSASAVYVLDLKGKVLKDSPPSPLPGNSGALALSGPTLLLGNWTACSARVRQAGQPRLPVRPVARKRPVVFARPAPSLAYLVGYGC